MERRRQAEIGVSGHQPGTADHRQEPEEAARDPQGALEGARLCWCLTFELWLPELLGSTFLLPRAPSLWQLVTAALGH